MRVAINDTQKDGIFMRTAIMIAALRNKTIFMRIMIMAAVLYIPAIDISKRSIFLKQLMWGHLHLS